MKHTFYSIMLAAGLLLFTAPAVLASSASTENPTATPRKEAATARTAKAAEKTKSTSNKSRKSLSSRSMLSVLGFGPAKSVTTPKQRDRQLRSLQKQLHAKARSEARTRRARCGQAGR